MVSSASDRIIAGSLEGGIAGGMSLNEELLLLVKSKYPVVFYETVDEEYAARQLRKVAVELGLSVYHWAITSGLKRFGKDGFFYKTREPTDMAQTVLSLVRSQDVEPGLFILCDFNRYLDNSLLLRQMKDIISAIRNTPHTVVMIAPSYELPAEIEVSAARISGGYPTEAEIEEQIIRAVNEFRSENEEIRMDLEEADLRRVLTSLKGLSLPQIRNVVSRCVLDDSVFDASDLEKIERYKRDIFDRTGILEFCTPEPPEGIANFDNLKEWLSDRRTSFDPCHEQDAPASQLPTPKGILLLGVQGCGKSLATRVAAGELGLPLYRLDLNRLYSKYIGETEQNLRRAFSTVENLAPLCLWIDEIEKVLAASHGDVDGGVSQRILATFLTWMQERTSPCFIAATANDVYRLPPEFLRKGRFDEIFFVDLPDRSIRLQLLRIHLEKRGLNPEDFDCEGLARACSGFSGAEIEQAIISALYRAGNRGEPLSTDHIGEQMESTRPLSVVKSEEIERLQGWARGRTVPA
jgi:hypothetical protein